MPKTAKTQRILQDKQLAVFSNEVPGFLSFSASRFNWLKDKLSMEKNRKKLEKSTN